MQLLTDRGTTTGKVKGKRAGEGRERSPKGSHTPQSAVCPSWQPDRGGPNYFLALGPRHNPRCRRNNPLTEQAVGQSPFSCSSCGAGLKQPALGKDHDTGVLPEEVSRTSRVANDTMVLGEKKKIEGSIMGPVADGCSGWLPRQACLPSH